MSDIDFIQQQISIGINPTTFLPNAIYSRNVETVRFLLTQGADPAIINEYNQSMLDLSIDTSPSIFLMLLDYVYDPYILNHQYKGLSVLMRATEKNQKDLVEQLLAKGVDIYIQDEYGTNNALDIAIIRGHIDIAFMIIEQSLKQPSAIDVFPFQKSLFLAIKHDRLDVAEAIIQHNLADVNALDEAQKSTPLITAAYYDNIQAIKLLLKYGADINLSNESSYAALHIAVLHNRIRSIELLLINNANPNLRIVSGDTALTLAIQHQYIDVVDLLLDYNADMDILNDMHKTPLDIALEDRQVNARLVLLLIKKKSQMYSIDYENVFFKKMFDNSKFIHGFIRSLVETQVPFLDLPPIVCCYLINHKQWGYVDNALSVLFNTASTDQFYEKTLNGVNYNSIETRLRQYNNTCPKLNDMIKYHRKKYSDSQDELVAEWMRKSRYQVENKYGPEYLEYITRKYNLYLSILAEEDSPMSFDEFVEVYGDLS